MKKLLGLLITGLTLISFSFAWVSHPINVVGTVGDGEVTTLKYGNLLSTFGGYSVPMFVYSSDIYFFFTSRAFDYKPYLRFGGNEGFISTFYLCPNFTGLINQRPGDCTAYDLWGNRNLYKAYLSAIDQDSIWAFEFYGGDRITPPYLMYCVSTNSVRSLCYNHYGGANLTGSLHLVDLNQSWSEVPSGYIGTSPGSPANNPGSSTGTVSSGSLISSNADADTIINYYEGKYNWDQSMCYVGTYDYTGVYATPGLEFSPGTGLNLFEYYYALYNTFGNNYIKNVGSFINSWLINYSEWFRVTENGQQPPKYLVTYNGPDTNITVYYTGLNFPFRNEPAATYFMASNLYVQYSREATQGEEMAYYCYVKLNKQDIDQGNIDMDQIESLVSTGINERIETVTNTNLNGSTNVNVSVQIPSSGSFWDEFGTGFQESDIQLDSSFSNFYEKISSLFRNYSPLHRSGILPKWIIYPMLLLILFRILKH